MRKIHEDHKDKAEFVFIYVREAHPSDSNWADSKMDVKDPTTDEQRRAVAARCAGSLNLTMTTLVDDLQDTVNMKYGAWPERMYVIDLGGKVAYRGGVGPFGFKPREARAALEKLLEAE